ncbi:hypoxanthine phosphoribosyltransferase [Paludibaculum fermentans]|uniref:Hypoxanthine phosphoribosyltransferase n=1 Tax=Paludibaculum fermentans TaxID=1473598 RepID=A0A7S7SHR9_PALFE|nr:hypoxanthine phosphoribosyltransferase [Paludibaculum fermentans]QOY84953.1 hypoxanthine phosphoribosyltransferase [Paludibaculum fermentans]
MASPKIEVLIPHDEIQARIAALGAQITADYQGRSIVLVGVLKGSFIFLADLVRHIDLPVRIEFIGTKSYEGTTTSGQVQLTKDLDKPIQEEDVLLVEDIIDTGLTLNYLQHVMSQRAPRSLKIASFLDKPSRRRIAVEGDYIGFTIEDKFVIGYGLDFDQRYRNLKDLCILVP